MACKLPMNLAPEPDVASERHAHRCDYYIPTAQSSAFNVAQTYTFRGAYQTMGFVHKVRAQPGQPERGSRRRPPAADKSPPHQS